MSSANNVHANDSGISKQTDERLILATIVGAAPMLLITVLLLLFFALAYLIEQSQERKLRSKIISPQEGTPSNRRRRKDAAAWYRPVQQSSRHGVATGSSASRPCILRPAVSSGLDEEDEVSIDMAAKGTTGGGRIGASDFGPLVRGSTYQQHPATASFPGSQQDANRDTDSVWSVLSFDEYVGDFPKARHTGCSQTSLASSIRQISEPKPAYIEEIQR